MKSFERAITVFRSLNDLYEISEVYFAMSEVYFNIGGLLGLNKITNIFSELISSNNYEEKKNELMVVHYYNDFIKSEDIPVDNLAVIVNQFFDRKEINKFFKSQFLLIKYLIQIDKYKEAYEILISENLKDAIENYPFFKAEKLYLLGTISLTDVSFDMKNSIDYFEEAFLIIKEKSITELTVKIVFAIAESYMNRGNLNRATDHIVLAKSLIDHISFNIRDIKLRSQYLNEPKRKKRIEKLEVWERFVK